MSEPARTPEGGERPSGAGSTAPLSRAEFAAGFEQCWRTLWCVAVGVLGDRAHAEDVVQEAALIAMGKLDQFDRETNLTAWLAKIVRNVALNHSRRRKIEKRWAMNARDEAARGEAAGRGGGATGGRASVLDRERILAAGRGGGATGGRVESEDAEFQGIADEQVLAALSILSDTARSCLLMRSVLDLSYREIAAALEIPPGTAMSHVHRAREALRTHLMERAQRAAAPKGDRR